VAAGCQPQEERARLIRVPSFTDERGTLAVMEWAEHLPFIPERFYYIYGATEEVKRAGHAHWEESEAVFAISGGFTVLTDDGRQRTEHHLESPDLWLVIPPGVWHEVHGFGPGAVCAVFASGRHNVEDYCRDYKQFLKRVQRGPAENPNS